MRFHTLYIALVLGVCSSAMAESHPDALKLSEFSRDPEQPMPFMSQTSTAGDRNHVDRLPALFEQAERSTFQFEYRIEGLEVAFQVTFKWPI